MREDGSIASAGRTMEHYLFFFPFIIPTHIHITPKIISIALIILSIVLLIIIMFPPVAAD